MMLTGLRKILTENLGLKALALLLAALSWYYIVKELNRGSREEMEMVRRILPPEVTVAKKLLIQPIVVGKPKRGYELVKSRITTEPDYCIVVGSKDLLDGIRLAFTLPIDISDASSLLVKSVPLKSIAPGIYMEETLVRVTLPVEKKAR